VAATIDTLVIAKRWRQAGSEDERAEVLATSLRELQEGQLAQLATKAELKAELATLEARLEARIDAAQHGMIRWFTGVMVAQAAAIVALVKLL